MYLSSSLSGNDEINEESLVTGEEDYYEVDDEQDSFNEDDEHESSGGDDEYESSEEDKDEVAIEDAELSFSGPPRRTGKKDSFYKHQATGATKSFTFSTFAVSDGDADFSMGTTGSGVQLKTSKLRKPHDFKTADLALLRVLTYLAENIFSHIAFPGKAEIQVAWISDINCLLITENNLFAFNKAIGGKNEDDLMELMFEAGIEKLPTQGQEGSFINRMTRHNQKLNHLLDVSSARHIVWADKDVEIKKLIHFLTGGCAGIYTIKKDEHFTIRQLQNKIVHYDNSLNVSNPTAHAELYHMALFKLIFDTYKGMRLDAPTCYVAGTKRACSTCAGSIEYYKEILGENLCASSAYPGNLWPAQIMNQTDRATELTLVNLEAQNMWFSCLKTKDITSGFNSDSNSSASDSDDLEKRKKTMSEKFDARRDKKRKSKQNEEKETLKRKRESNDDSDSDSDSGSDSETRTRLSGKIQSKFKLVAHK